MYHLIHEVCTHLCLLWHLPTSEAWEVISFEHDIWTEGYSHSLHTSCLVAKMTEQTQEAQQDTREDDPFRSAKDDVQNNVDL